MVSGAITSIFDLGTDIFVCYIFWKKERTAFFQMTLVSIMLSIVLQLAFVFIQYQKQGIRSIIYEMLPVLVGLKPALDAFRIAAGRDRDEAGAVVDRLSELTSTKACELFVEAIPGVIIQVSREGRKKRAPQVCRVEECHFVIS